jgi:hypothetical protein
MGLLSWVGEKISGVNIPAQQIEIDRMETALAAAKVEAQRIASCGVPQEVANKAAAAEILTPNKWGDAGTSPSIIQKAIEPGFGFFANFGSAIGSFFGAKGVGDADPGSIAETASEITSGIVKKIPTFTKYLVGAAVVAAIIIGVVAYGKKTAVS